MPRPPTTNGNFDSTPFSFGGNSDSVLVNVVAVPEPGWTELLMAGGMIALATIRRACHPAPAL